MLPPIERLCEHIEGTEKARLAECLGKLSSSHPLSIYRSLTKVCSAGLDAVNYKSSLDAPEREFKTLQSQISDAQRFADAIPFNVRCRACGSSTAFEPLGAKSVSLDFSLAGSVLGFELTFFFMSSLALSRSRGCSAAISTANNRSQSLRSLFNSTFRFDRSSPNSMKLGLSAMNLPAAIEQG